MLTYVDLNPIRAKMAELPETSDFTSIQSRLYEKVKTNKINTANEQQLKDRIQAQKKLEVQLQSQLDKEDQSIHLNNLGKATLFPFACSTCSNQHSIPFGLEDYIELVDTTGRIIREGKRGFIDDKAPPIISRLGIDDTKWIRSVKKYGTLFGFAAGKASLVRKYAAKLENAWSKGVGKIPQEMYKPSLT